MNPYLLKIGTSYTVDFDKYLDMFENVAGRDPMMVFSEFVKLQLKINDAYREYSEEHRRLSRDKNELVSRLRTRCAAKDESNPLLQDNLKVTQANVTAWIESSPEYLSLKEALDENQEQKNTLGSIRILVDKCLDMIKINCKNQTEPTRFISLDNDLE